MNKQCAATGCQGPTSGYSTYCERHKRAQRRHGHVHQDGVTVPELKPYRDRVAARRKKNPANPAWEILETRWMAVAAHAAETLKGHAAGRPGVRYAVLAADHIQRLADAVPHQVVTETALAMFVMREVQPNRFRSDRAFDFQLARRVRALTDANAGSYYDQGTGKLKRVYRDVLPGTLECLAGSLKEAFGVAGLRLAELDKKDDQRQADANAKLAEALRGLA
ncbi:MAG TPA: hypothetical protein VN617_12255 [Rhodoferax sp.]|nr:hypothetical protein [Rhodoferax sp.]